MTPTAPVVLGVPIDCVGEPGGTELAPAALRDAGIVVALGATDAGDVPVSIRGQVRDATSGVLALASVIETIAGVRAAVRDLLGEGRVPILLAGDCTATIGACAAARDVRDDPGLVYVDGHIDLYDGRTSPTGESADFPLAVVCGYGPPELRAAAHEVDPIIAPDAAALLGPRDMDEARRLGSLMPDDVEGDLLFLDVEAVRAAGPTAAGARGASHADALGNGFWLHVDLDVLGQEDFPATDYLMPGGLEWAELTDLLRPAAHSPHCLGITLACFNPEKDASRTWAGRIVSLVEDALTRP